MTQTKKRGLAFLIEDTFEKLAPVMAAQDIADKLQDMLESLGKILPDDIMPLQDNLSKHYGADVAQRFSQSVMEQVNQAIAAVQNAKMAIDGEIKRLESGASGGDMSDLAMDAGMAPAGVPETPPGAGPEAAPGVPGAAPGAPAPEGMPEGPEAVGPPPEGAEAAPEAGMEMGGNFAGRPRKESAKPRGKMVREFVDTGGLNTPAHPYKSQHFNNNLEGLKVFHGGLGRLARNIERMIDSGKLNGAEREGLTNTLSNMASVAHDAGHWIDPESKLQSSLLANHLTDANDAEVGLIVKHLRQLAHGMALKHSQVMENSIVALRKSRNPDALVFKTFRGKLTEAKDAQLAAIRTARQYAIDVDDVVMIVKEASQRRIREDYPQQPNQPGTVQPVTNVQPGVPIFPVTQNAPAVATQPPVATQNPVMQGEPNYRPNPTNQSASTRKPMSPAEKKASVLSQSAMDVQRNNMAPQNSNGNGQQGMTNQQKKRTLAGVGTSPQPNLR